jgi:hypothetical protein
LSITQNGQDGRPSFLSFATISGIFGAGAAHDFAQEAVVGALSLAPRALKGSNDPLTDVKNLGAVDPNTINAGARQAGFNGLLIDQSGNPVLYAIHLNKVFVDFVLKNNLNKKDGIKNADPAKEFEAGAIEIKSAWKILEATDDPSTYITVQKAAVPRLKSVAGKLQIDTTLPTREADVALLSMHVVFVLKGHPEFIWATFEHVDGNGIRDLAPQASALPAGDNGLPGGLDAAISEHDYILYKAKTKASQAASGARPDESALVKFFDESAQKFLNNSAPFQTSIYRIFPGSKPSTMSEDDEILEINRSIDNIRSKNKTDKRLNYRLVGAVWLDEPQKNFVVGARLKNPAGVGSDQVGAIVVGEDGLSSMAMESFTQDSFINCLSCHDARKITTSNGETIVDAKKINVSHVFSKFLSDEKTDLK